MIKILVLILLLSLSSVLFCFNNSEWSDERKNNYYKAWKVKQTKYLDGNVLMMTDDAVFLKIYNLIDSRGGVIADEFMKQIKYNGGRINKHKILVEVVEVSKLNKNIVRVKMKENYTNCMNDWYWINLGNIKNRK